MNLFQYQLSKYVVFSLMIVTAPKVLNADSHEPGEIKVESQTTAPAPSSAPMPYPGPYNYQMPPMKAIPQMPPMRQIPPMQPIPPMNKMPPMRVIPPYQTRPYAPRYRQGYAPPAYRSYRPPYRAPGYSGQPVPQNQGKQPVTEGTSQSIAISGMQYNPAQMEIKVGESIIWTNQDAAPHTVTAKDGISFASTTLSQGATFKHTFSKAGRYDYYCTYHPNMSGTVIVK